MTVDMIEPETAPAVEGALLASYKFEGFGKDPSKKTRGVLTRLQVVVKENELIADLSIVTAATTVAERDAALRSFSADASTDGAAGAFLATAASQLAGAA